MLCFIHLFILYLILRFISDGLRYKDERASNLIVKLSDQCKVLIKNVNHWLKDALLDDTKKLIAEFANQCNLIRSVEVLVEGLFAKQLFIHGLKLERKREENFLESRKVNKKSPSSAATVAVNYCLFALTCIVVLLTQIAIEIEIDYTKKFKTSVFFNNWYSKWMNVATDLYKYQIMPDDAIMRKFGLGKRKVNWVSTSNITIGSTNWPVCSQELQRIASYRVLPLQYLSQPLSVLKLAEGGFSYRGKGDTVGCDSCENEVQLSSFLSGDAMVSPREPAFHKDRCHMLITENYGGEDDTPPVKTKPLGPEFRSKTTSVSEEAPKNAAGGQTHREDNRGDLLSDVENENNLQVKNVTGELFQNFEVVNESSSLIGAAGTSTFATNLDFTANSDDGYISDDPNFIDSHLFDQEHTAMEGNTCRKGEKNQPLMQEVQCEKNPGHFGYVSMDQLRLSVLPRKLRDELFLTFLQLISSLTVRIVVSSISDRRHKDDSVNRGGNVRYGSGWMSLHENEFGNIGVEVGGSSGEVVLKKPTDKGKWKTVKSFVKTLVKKDAERIYIETNRHLVFDQSEAVNTKVEFFFDRQGRQGVKVIGCVGMRPKCNLLGDNRVILECRTGDRDFVRDLRRRRREVMGLAERLPAKIKAALCKKPFIIHHPHGREKHISFGDSVPVRYLLTEAARGKDRMVKVNKRSVGNDVRKVLLYAVDTCPGTSGAPVLTFKKVHQNEAGVADFALDVWTHNGVEKNSKLGASTMRALEPQDTLMLSQQEQQQNGSPDDEDSEDEDPSLGKTKVTGPSIKIMAPAMHRKYACYEERLRSFQKAMSVQVHSKEYLSQAGFFYGGEGDHVRCFHCGLGLQSWKSGDNVYLEHQKHRPDCRYLQIQMKAGLPVDVWKADSQSGETTQKVEMSLLQKENDKLNSYLLCKVCCRAQVKDLFLPCGELYACSDCSKLLTHCPSCDQPIMATVITYLT